MSNVIRPIEETENKEAIAIRKQYRTELGRMQLNKILCENRRREEYTEIESLAESIRVNGLVEPIVVMRVEGDPLYEGKVLGGGRRYYACVLAQQFDIPVNIYPAGLSLLEQKRIENIENKDRQDFTWQEKVKMHAELYDLYIAEYGEKSRLGTGVSMRDIAKDIGISVGMLSTDVELAKAMKSNPDIEKCTSQMEAIGCNKKNRLVEENKKRVVEVQKQRAVIESVSTLPANAPEIEVLQAIYNSDLTQKHRICDAYIVNDFLLAAKDLEDSSFDVIEVDPPYGIDLAMIKSTDSDERLMNEKQYTEVAVKDYPKFLSAVIKECTRLLSECGWIIWWYAAQPWANVVYQTLLHGGEETDEIILKGNRNNAIWYKSNNQSQTQNPKYNLGSCYEPFYYMRKGAAAFIQKQGHSNVFSHPAVPSNGKCHPTERPIELMTDILETFGRPGDSVLVPFAGSGVTLLAAHNLHMHVTGFDIDKDGAYKAAFVSRVMSGELGKFK